jgi:hypothetical protein
MMRGGTIEQHSPLEMVRNVMVGTWTEYEKNSWHIVTCPLFTVMEKVCQPGPNVFPLVPWRQTFVDIVYDGGYDKKLVKPGQTIIDIDRASFVRLVQFGQGDK